MDKSSYPGLVTSKWGRFVNGYLFDKDSVLIGGVVLITGVSPTMFWVRGVPSVASIIEDVSSGVI